MKYVIICVVQQATLIATFLYDLGVSWIDTGHGFHPMAAGALAIVLMLAPYLMAQD